MFGKFKLEHISNIDSEEYKYICANENCSATVYIQRGMIIRQEGEHTHLAPSGPNLPPAATCGGSQLRALLEQPLRSPTQQQSASNPTGLQPAGNAAISHEDAAGGSVYTRIHIMYMN